MTITRADGKHIHYDLIVEWAKNPTRIVQYKYTNPDVDDWRDCSQNKPRWAEGSEYRFKPEIITITHRRALMKTSHGYYSCYVSPILYQSITDTPVFVKWLGEEITETIEI